MRKLITAMILTSSFFFLVACSENEDRSFSIDEVAIDAQIDAEGSFMYVNFIHIHLMGHMKG